MPRTPASKPKKREKTQKRPTQKRRARKPAKTTKVRGAPRGRPFQPGNPGGPGRPPIPKDYKLAMEDLGPRGLQAVSDIVDDPAHPRHADVAMYAVNRWRGTPKARTEISGPDGGAVPVTQVMTSGAKRARLAELQARAKARLESAAAAKKKPGSDDPGGSD